MKLRVMTLFAAIVVGIMTVSAQGMSSAKSNCWWMGGTYALNVANNNHTSSRLGVTGGYLGNWGGYARVTFDAPVEGNWWWHPSVTAGFTKRLASFRNNQSLHLNLGVGLGSVRDAREFSDNETTSCFWDDSGAFMAETGLIFRHGHLVAGLGYNIAFDVDIYSSNLDSSSNSSIQLTIGYAF